MPVGTRGIPEDVLFIEFIVDRLQAEGVWMDMDIEVRRAYLRTLNSYGIPF